jgi:hypothetical protein
MNTAHTLAHLQHILHGTCATLAVFTLFYAAGVALHSLLPRRPRRETLECDGYPAVLVAALFILWCWYAIQLGVDLEWATATFVGLLAVLIGLRIRAVAWELRARHVLGRETAGWVAIFAAMYAVSYLFFTPSVTGEHLPLATYLNNDLMNYLNVTVYLQRLGPSNLAGVAWLESAHYLFTPGVFYGIALLSWLFGGDPMSAAMPLQFSLSALIALLAARLSRAVFSTSLLWATAIAAALISGPFFRYVAGNYFLSTLMSVPVLLHLIWMTVGCGTSHRWLDVRLLARFGAHYVLLLFLYPALLVLAVAIQLSIAVTFSLLEMDWRAPFRRYRYEDARRAARLVLACAGALALTAIVAPVHIASSAGNVLYITRRGSAGWALDLISPASLFGLPGRFALIQIASPAHRVPAMLALVTGALLLAGAYVVVLKSEASPTERVFALTGAGAVFVYCLAFQLLGPSYQQWKLASYLTLPLSFVVAAATVRVGHYAGGRCLSRYPRLLRVSGVLLPAAVFVVFVGGNLRVHATEEGRPWSFPARLRNLAAVDRLPSFPELYVQMVDYRTTFLAPYFIRTKRLLLVSQSYYPTSALSLDSVSRRRPFLLQDFGCVGAGHPDTITIDGVGCLMFNPPSPELDVSYPFNQTFYFVRPRKGIGRRGAAGRQC